EPFLDRVLIEFVDDPVHRRAVEPRVVGPQRALSPRVGDLLDANDDVHDRWPTSLPLSASARHFASGWVKTAKRGPPGPMRGACPAGGTAMLLASSFPVESPAPRPRPRSSAAWPWSSGPRRPASAPGNRPPRRHRARRHPPARPRSW